MLFKLVTYETPVTASLYFVQCCPLYLSHVLSLQLGSMNSEKMQWPLPCASATHNLRNSLVRGDEGVSTSGCLEHHASGLGFIGNPLGDTMTQGTRYLELWEPEF